MQVAFPALRTEVDAIETLPVLLARSWSKTTKVKLPRGEQDYLDALRA